MRPRIFISYTHRSERDVTLAFRLATHLRDFGCEVWIDKTRLWPGSKFPQEIYRAIDDCDYFVVLLSPASIESDWVKKEIVAAQSHQARRDRPLIIPSLLSDCTIPREMREIEYADFRSGYKNGLAQTIATIWRNRHGYLPPYEEEDSPQIVARLLSCSDSDEEISQVLRANQVEAGRLVVLEPEIFVNRHEEIEIFLSVLEPTSPYRVLVFDHAGKEPQLGSSLLLRILAYADVNDLIHLAGATHTDPRRFLDIHRLLFRSEEGFAGSFYYYTDILNRTIKAIGERYFTNYRLTMERQFSNNIAENIGLSQIIRQLHEQQPYFQISSRSFMDYANQPSIRGQITRAFLRDMANVEKRVIWLIDGPWDRLPLDTVEWTKSILTKVGRGEIQNLWLVFGGRVPIQIMETLRPFSAFRFIEIRPFTRQAVEKWLKVSLNFRGKYLKVLATGIWSASRGHPARIAHALREIHYYFPNYRLGAVEQPRTGYYIVWPDWLEEYVQNE